MASRIRSIKGKATRGVVSMAKKSVGDLTGADLKGKKVFIRADLNVPLDDTQKITDDTRIRAAIPTIKHLIQNGAKVILSSHLVCGFLTKSIFSWVFSVFSANCKLWSIKFSFLLESFNTFNTV